MIITPVKTKILTPPRDDLFAAISHSLPRLEERSILAVTSKVVAIGEGRAIPETDAVDKDALIRKEADKFLPRGFMEQKWVMHTIKNNLFIPSAGIDESNANGYYILWPEDSMKSAQRIGAWAKERYGVKDLGVIITDSHTIPLRRGTLGISLGHWGFNPLKDYRKEKDLFGRQFVFTLMDIADGLAAATVVAMGEGKESTPLAVIQDIPFVEFGERFDPKEKFSSLEIEEKEDLYYPFFASVPWQEGKGGKEEN